MYSRREPLYVEKKINGIDSIGTHAPISSSRPAIVPKSTMTLHDERTSVVREL